MNRLPLIFICFNVFLYADTATLGKTYEYYLKGEYSLLQKNYPQAESDFHKALSGAPNSPTILQSLVDIKLYQGEYKDAIIYLERMLELAPKNKETGLELLQLYIQEGKINEAEKLLDTLLEYHQSEIELLYTQANIMYLNKDWTNLLKTYKSIYLSDTDNMDILTKIYEIGLIDESFFIFVFVITLIVYYF